MDNTEIHYVTYDPDEIWNEMQQAYIDAGGDILYPGDEKEMLLRSVLADIVQVFAGVDNALRMQTLRYAVGDYLDVIGEARSCERIQAQAATATAQITARATGQARTIAKETLSMTADGEVFYTPTEDITLSGISEVISVTIVADRSGAAGNALASGTQMQLASTISAIESIITTSAGAGGNDKEDDEVYRARICEYGLASVSTGPSRQYESQAKAVSSIILDAKAVNLGAGNVGVYLLLSDPESAAGIISDVEAALSAEDVRPLTDNVTVALATDISYTLNVGYESDGSSSTQAAVAQAVVEYQEWQDNVIGRAFNPDRLMAAIYQAGATRVIWQEGSEFNGGNVEYTEIAETEHCVGNIMLTAL